MKESFVLFTKYYEYAELLTDEQAGVLLKAILRYEADMELPEMDAITKITFLSIKSQLDATDRRYEASVENGKKGGRPKKEENKKPKKTQTKPNQNLKKPNHNPTETQAKPIDIEIDIDIDNEIDTDIDIDNDLKETPTESVSKKKTSKKESPVYFPDDAALDDNFKEFIKMRKQIKAPMTDRAVSMAMKKLKELSGGDSTRAIRILENSIRNSWKDLYPLKESPPDVKKDLSTQTYDFEKLEQQLLARKRI